MENIFFGANVTRQISEQKTLTLQTICANDIVLSSDLKHVLYKKKKVLNKDIDLSALNFSFVPKVEIEVKFLSTTMKNPNFIIG